MNRILATSMLAIVASLTSPASSLGASLQVAPVSLQVIAPGANTSLQLTNEGEQPISAQIRVFRWSQAEGAEELAPSDAVVVSPPAVTLTPHQQYTVRVIRLDQTPISAEETYRVIVDELPDAARMQNGAVTMTLRYSIPLFFTAPAAAPPHLSWGVESQKNQVTVVAKNDGDRRLRLSAMKLRDKSGAVASFGDGLVGYVLGHSSMRFVSRGKSGGFGAGSVSIKADSDLGRLDAVAPITK
ncbi:MAG TPA: molecular chaperone [Methylocystis sp.]|nr:molecular chaperone [Methylocystis sp.]